MITTTRPNGPAIEIDLGTRYFCVAVIETEQVIIKTDLGTATPPSYIAFNDSNEATVGEVAKNQANLKPENTVFEVKRLIGRDTRLGFVSEDMSIRILQQIRLVSARQANVFLESDDFQCDVEIVMGGGSSKMLHIQQMVQHYFGGKQLSKTIKPNEAVACGAAVLAAFITFCEESNVNNRENYDRPKTSRRKTTGAPGSYDKDEHKIADMLENYFPEIFPEYPRKTKGIALIINQVSFDGRPQNFRKGAEKDQNDLVEMLQELGFRVYGLRDRTYMELKGDIESFLNIVAEEKPDCLVVAVMSHGNENYFMTRDNGWISSWEEIVEKFNNVNCPTLIGKPKIFLFQFSRGNIRDGGTTQIDSFQEFEDDYGSSPNIPSGTDMLVCYSIMEGYSSYRDPMEGNGFIQLFCKAVRKYGRTMDICNLLNLVSEMMKMLSAKLDMEQICPYYTIGFTKKFYLGN